MLRALWKVPLVLLYRWEELNSLAEERRKLLAGAEQVHRFVRDAVETNDRMNEKVLCPAITYHTTIRAYLSVLSFYNTGCNIIYYYTIR